MTTLSREQQVFRRNIKSATSECIDYIRSQIVSRRWADGEAIVIDQLARELGVSHTPIREALRGLASDGFVEYKPRIGARVIGISQAEFDELVDLQLLLEPKVLERAIQIAPDGAFDLAEEKMLERESIKEGTPFDPGVWDFYLALYEPSKMKRTLDIIVSNWNLYNRYISVGWGSSEDIFKEDLEQKKRILDLCRSHQGKDAAKMLRSHIKWSVGHFKANLS
ncbi:MAG: GntR family transcriptional regulator [Rhodobacteraceae bacterium]|nr:GntR family transcriptional regulator [Paracoccaceae bacterium]